VTTVTPLVTILLAAGVLSAPQSSTLTNRALYLEITHSSAITELMCRGYSLGAAERKLSRLTPRIARATDALRDRDTNAAEPEDQVAIGMPCSRVRGAEKRLLTCLAELEARMGIR
jgi:hypothetical protein